MPAERLSGLQLPERLREAIDEFKRTRSHEGRRRQLQFIGKLMRSVDAEPLLAAVAAERLGPARAGLAASRGRALAPRAGQRRRRPWLAGRSAHPDSDAQRLRALVLAARREGALPPGQRHGRAWRELFQFVKLNVARS